MRLIDADVLKEKAKWYNIYSDKPPHSIRAVTTQEIDWMPTIEPERKRGRWIDGSIPTYAVCSECGYQERYAYENNFCPSCGSAMEGAKQE